MCFPGGKIHGCLRLPPAEVTIVVVGRDWLAHVWQRCIDDQMMMAGVFFDRPGRCEPEAFQAGNYGYRAVNNGSVGGADDTGARRMCIGERGRGRNKQGGDTQAFEYGSDPVGWEIPGKVSRSCAPDCRRKTGL